MKINDTIVGAGLKDFPTFSDSVIAPDGGRKP